MKRDHHAVLEQFRWVIGANLRDRPGDPGFESGLHFFKQQIFR
jgi:hypothetical protein